VTLEVSISWLASKVVRAISGNTLVVTAPEATLGGNEYQRAAHEFTYDSVRTQTAKRRKRTAFVAMDPS